MRVDAANACVRAEVAGIVTPELRHGDAVVRLHLPARTKSLSLKMRETSILFTTKQNNLFRLARSR